MKKTLVLFSLMVLLFSNCISTKIVSNKSDDFKTEKVLVNKRVMFVLEGDERSIDFYRKLAADIAQDIGKAHKISCNYVVKSPLSFLDEDDIKRMQQDFKADYILNVKVGRYETNVYDINDYYNSRVEEKILNINLKCLTQNKDIWKAVLSIGSIDISANKGHFNAAKRLVNQLKEDNLI